MQMFIILLLDLADTDVKSLMNKAFSWTLSESSLSDFDSKLISIILPKNCKEIGWEVFDGCTRLQIVSLPSTLEKIGMFAFAQTAIKSINIPFKVTRIEEATFLMCQNLSSITMKNVAFIGNNAFTQCSNLSQIDLPKSLVTIEHNAFSDKEYSRWNCLMDLLNYLTIFLWVVRNWKK